MGLSFPAERLRQEEVLQVLTCIHHLLEVKFSEVQRFRDFKVVSLTTSSTK